MAKETMIVSSYDESRVLYVAKGAADVRAAVEAAVASGANLRDANLSGANLSDANLRDANLRDANLRGANLSGANLRGANLRDANLSGANLRGAYLSGANLRGAYLRGANLSGANLRDANLSGANLSDANLCGAYLSGANGLNPHLINDLLMMKDQVGKIRAYKLVTANGYGPTYGGIRYEVKGDFEVADADCSDDVACGPGINLATLSWCMRQWQTGYRILLAEFKASDIAALPIGDGKFRVRRCHIVRELDLEEIGLVTEEGS